MKRASPENGQLAAATPISAPAPTASSPKRRRRLVRFSLRTFLMAMTMLCIWIGVTATRARRQQHAVDTIQRLGGTIAFDFQRRAAEGGAGVKVEIPGPEWARRILGDHYFVTPVALGVTEQRVIDEGGLELLPEMPELRELWFNDVELRRRDLRHLRRLRQLRFLNFGDDTLPVKHDLADFEFLRNYSHLDGLRVEGAGFGDRDLSCLENSPNLKNLFLHETHVGDDGLAYIGRLTNLRLLGLAQTRVTDAGLVHLRSLSKLKCLNLNACAITDEGLRHLHQLAGLSVLELHWTKVTAGGIDNLKLVLPACEIGWTPTVEASVPTPGRK